MFIKNMPSYLTRADVEEWIRRFDQCMRSFLGNSYLSSFEKDLTYGTYNPYNLEFSDELIYEDGDLLSLEEAKTKILDKWVKPRARASEDECIKDLIKRIEDAKTAEDLGEHASTIAEVCCSRGSEEDDENSYQSIYQSIRSLLNRTLKLGQRNRFYALGRYIYDERKIVLYVNAINPSGVSAKLPLFEEVFAHEVFHAYHHYACEFGSQNSIFNEIRRRVDYTSKVVKESLAAFFELYYCGKNGIYTDIESDWVDNPVYIYPYSGAKYLLPLEASAPSLFLSVFKTSLVDLDKALRLLLETNPSDFYRVKNVAETIIKTVTKKVYVSTSSTPAMTLSEQEMEQALKTMGRGWFILKYAEDYRKTPSPIKLDYGKPSSYSDRMSMYLKMRPFHDELIRHLKQERLGPNVSAGMGGLKVNYIELQRILDSL